jgi:hypothetical protein
METETVKFRSDDRDRRNGTDELIAFIGGNGDLYIGTKTERERTSLTAVRIGLCGSGGAGWHNPRFARAALEMYLSLRESGNAAPNPEEFTAALLSGAEADFAIDEFGSTEENPGLDRESYWRKRAEIAEQALLRVFSRAE